MPGRSTVYGLPPDLRRRLDARLSRAGWAGYAQHVAWLAGEGHTISVSALQRYGVRRRREIETERLLDSIRVSTDEAEAITAALAEQGVALAEASQHLVQEHVYRALRRLPPDASHEEVMGAARMQAQVTRSHTALRREGRAEAAATADRVADAARRHGVSAEAIAALRREIECGA